MARIGDEWDRDKLDYLGPDIVEYWVNLHTYEMRDERIAREMKRIRTKRKRDRGGGRRNR